MVQGVGNNDSFGQYAQVQRDLNSAKAVAQNVDTIEADVAKIGTGIVIPLRRMQSVPKKIKEGDTVAAVAAGGIAFMTLPEDLRDIRAGYRQVKAKITGEKYVPSYVSKDFQHDFSWLKGTFFQKILNKIKSQKGKETVAKIYVADKSLYNTPLGEFIKRTLNITDGKSKISEVKDIFGRKMEVTEIKAPNAFAELTGRAMKRITVFGLAALALLELPKIFKATGQGDNFLEQSENTVKQTVRAIINVASIAAGIGYCGAIGAKHGGAFGSLLGMSIGAVAGAAASNKIQEIIA